MSRASLATAFAGRGRLLLIGGEAGIGKTALLNWLADEARQRGGDVLVGHGYDLMLTPPYGPWSEALAGTGRPDGLPNPLAGDLNLPAITSRTLLVEGVRCYLGELSRDRPVVLALEDAHWADPASLELLRDLARGLSWQRVLLIVTYRSDELTRSHLLFQIMPYLVHDAGAERIDLQTFDEHDVGNLINGHYTLAPPDLQRLVHWLQARGQGNPFFLTELLRTLEVERILEPDREGWRLGRLDRSTVPTLVRQIIEGRMSVLDDNTRGLLEIAAVIGQEVPLNLWQTVSEAETETDRLADALEAASGARLLAEASAASTMRFTHALVRETLYDGIALTRRRLLHRRIAEALVLRSEPPVNVVASHFSQADDPRAIDWLCLTGEQALARYASQDAIVALDLAHDLAGRFDRELPATAYRTRAAAHTLRGEFNQARRDYELVLDRSRATGDSHAIWQALDELSLLWAERDYDRTGDYCRAALDLARSMDDPSLIAHSLNRVANWHVNRDEPETALPLHREALTIFESTGDQVGVADSLDLLGMASYLSCDLTASTDYYERAIPLFRARDELQRVAACLAALTFNGGEVDSNIAKAVYREPAYWIGCGEEGLAIAREIGWPAGEALALFALSMSAGARGHYGRALRDARAALVVAEQVDHRQWATAARFALGSLWVDLLDPARARSELEQGLADARMIGSRFWTTTIAGSLAAAEIMAGNVSQAWAILETVIQTDRPRQSMGQRLCWFSWAKLTLARGEANRALEILDRLRDEGQGSHAGADTPPMLKLRGDALASLGHRDDAERAYLAAYDEAAVYGFRPFLWRLDAALGAFYREAGRAADADAICRRAQITIEALATEIDDDAIREPFRTQALGRLPAPTTTERTSVAATRLSPRELDVLRLLVEGKADREIAAALFISPRTVMRHVTAILTKLDVPTRTAAAALAIRNGSV